MSTHSGQLAGDIQASGHEGLGEPVPKKLGSGRYWCVLGPLGLLLPNQGWKRTSRKPTRWILNPLGVLSQFNTWVYQDSSHSLCFSRKNLSVFPLELTILSLLQTDLELHLPGANLRGSQSCSIPLWNFPPCSCLPGPPGCSACTPPHFGDPGSQAWWWVRPSRSCWVWWDFGAFGGIRDTFLLL